MKEEILYQFLHNWDTIESAYYTVSIHRTEEGAKKAMLLHKYVEESKDPDTYGQAWMIESIKLRD